MHTTSKSDLLVVLEYNGALLAFGVVKDDGHAGFCDAGLTTF